MRQALNENPLVQIAVLAGAAVLLAVVFMMQMGGGGEEPAPPPAAPAAGAPAPAAAGGSAVAPGSSATAPAPTASQEPEAVTPVPSGADAGTEGLPPEYVKASGSGKPVAIFVVRGKPVSDKVVGGYADRLRGSGAAEVFVISPNELADWVRVVGPAGVDRTPALVVVGPESGAAQPTASVSYGFRNYESVQQAVKDSTYDGPVRGYDPN